TLEGGINRRRKLVPTASFDTTPHEELSTTDSRRFAELRVDVPALDRLDLAGRVFYDGSSYSGSYPYSSADGGRERELARGDWAGLEATATWRPLDGLGATAGVDGQRYFQVVQRLADDSGGRTLDDRAFSTYALFAQAEAELGDRVTLTGGGRWDHYDTFGGRFSPRAAAVVRPFERTAVKLMYGEAFRAPSLYELYYDYPTGGLLENPDLRPEVVRHEEAEVEQELLHGRIRLVASYFHYEALDLIEAVDVPGASASRYENARDARGDGAEVAVDGRLPWRDIRGGLSYTFAHVVDAATGDRLSNSPQHLVLGRISAPLWDDRLFLALAGRFVGERPGLPGKHHADAAATLDVTLTWEDLLPRLGLGAGVTNVADRRWTIPGSFEHREDQIPEEGRTFWVKLTYEF
ncbi:MAG TPA: TonB-dependent receptor, partial [Planctomycetota bacterium]|nr:TonB-dependent receptor [Planctomycetota bacterium]